MKKLRKPTALLLIFCMLLCRLVMDLANPVMEVQAGKLGVEETIFIDKLFEERAKEAKDNAKPSDRIAEDSQDQVDALWRNKAEYVDVTKLPKYNLPEEETTTQKITKDAAGEAAWETFLEGADQVLEGLENADPALSGDISSKALHGLLDAWNILNIIKAGIDLQNLEGSLELQIAQYISTLATLIVAALAFLGVIGFPWSMLIGFILALITSYLKDDETVERSLEGWELDDRGQLYYWDGKQKVPANVNAYKPNIYIYSSESQKVTVEFDYPQLLTVTIPEYKDSWTVTTGENGMLTDEEGNAYRYLFYESDTTKSLFQTDSGYRISADQRAQTFDRLLMDMGFTKQEREDFIEFWNEKLPEGVDYVMYPQSTDIVDLAMPVRISPAPESIERIWFVFLTDEGQEVKNPEEIVLVREDSYSVVEWGGLIFDEDK